MANPIVATTVKSGIGFFKLLKIVIGVLVFGLIFLNCAIIIIQQGSVQAGFEYLGYNFLYTTEKLQDESMKIIDRGVFFPNESEKFISNLWEFMKNFGNLFASLVIIYGWLWIIAQFLLVFPIADNSKIFTAWIIAIILFLLIQMIIILAFTEKSFWTPILAFRDLGKAIYISIQPLTQSLNKYDSEVNNISDKIYNITI